MTSKWSWFSQQVESVRLLATRVQHLPWGEEESGPLLLKESMWAWPRKGLETEAQVRWCDPRHATEPLWASVSTEM